MTVPLLTPFLNQLDSDVLNRVASEQDLFSALERTLGAIEGMPAPPMQEVPPGLNPLAAMAGTFTSQLAEQLGAKGSVEAQAKQQNLIRGRREAAKQQNFAAQQQHFQQKQMGRLAQLNKIAEAELEVFKHRGDIEKIKKLQNEINRREQQIMKLRETIETSAATRQHLFGQEDIVLRGHMQQDLERLRKRLSEAYKDDDISRQKALAMIDLMKALTMAKTIPDPLTQMEGGASFDIDAVMKQFEELLGGVGSSSKVVTRPNPAEAYYKP